MLISSSSTSSTIAPSTVWPEKSGVSRVKYVAALAMSPSGIPFAGPLDTRATSIIFQLSYWFQMSWSMLVRDRLHAEGRRAAVGLDVVERQPFRDGVYQ